MSKRTRNRPGRDSAGGVSEIIGAVLMISLVVTAVAIVAVVLSSQTTPEKIPNVNFMTGTNAAGTQLYLYHNGGDTLRRGEFAVVTDTDPTPRTDYTISDGSNEWSIGRNLILAVPAPPNSVALIYTSGQSGGMVLRSGSSNVAVLRETIRPDPIPGYTGTGAGGLDTSNPQNVVNYILSNTSLIGDALNQSPQTVGPVVANVVGANAISFFKDNQVSLTYDGSGSYYFTYNVTKPGATMSVQSVTPTPYPLAVGDQVTLYMRASTSTFKAFGIGDQLWEVSAKGVDVNLKHYTVQDPAFPVFNKDVYHSWVPGYQDLGSTLKIQTSGAGQTVLVVNGTKRIDGVDSSSVVITNIRPVGVGLFVLEGDNSAHIVYFVGNAQSVTRNGVPVV